LGDQQCGWRQEFNPSITHSLYALLHKEGIKGRKTYPAQEVIVGGERRNVSGVCENYFVFEMRITRSYGMNL
jgi:hypothetical protein